MCRLSAFAIAVALTSSGCAVLFPPIEPAAPETVAAAAQPALPPDAPITRVDITDLQEKVECENLTRGGSRIVVAKRCRAKGDSGVDELAVADQIDQVRRDQEELDRRRRELEARRGPGLY
jgi:hypothetical protein